MVGIRMATTGVSFLLAQPQGFSLKSKVYICMHCMYLNENAIAIHFTLSLNSSLPPALLQTSSQVLENLPRMDSVETAILIR